MVLRILILWGCLFASSEVYSWGFFAHRLINKQACYNIPVPLISFYKTHSAYITNHATDPDNRRGFVPGEACRHFLDGDFYERACPFDTLPKNWDAAVLKYSEDTLQAHGIVPWHCYRMFKWLIKAFTDKNVETILQLSAELGHYIADANVPLHTTSNYNGQFTGQHGIHAFWESRIPEKSANEYPIFVSEAQFIPSIQDSFWTSVEHSYSLVKQVLWGEMKVRNSVPEHLKFGYFLRNGKPIKRESDLYISAYEKTQNGTVLEQMKHSIFLVSSAWYTAWVLAGEPNLSESDFVESTLFTIPADSSVLDHSH